ncbi:MAG: Cof-type HAD-IIB family hydrolase [Oscillospiraceae bacterium]
MIQSLKDILVLSDMDGTLLDSNKKLSTANLETIRLFTMLGGHFAVATGRMPDSVARYRVLAEYLSPSITAGGSIVYDFEEEEIKKNLFLPFTAGHRAMREVMELFPEVGVTLMSRGGTIYQIRPSQEGLQLYSDEYMTIHHCPEEDLPDNWNKVLFAGAPSLLEEIEDYVSRQEYPGMYFVMTDKHYLEMMPLGATKGNLIQTVCEMVGVSVENSYVIGDYYNDVDMMKKGGYSVAMGNAPVEIKRLANEVTATCEHSGVGQFLYKLIKRFG